MWWPWRWITQTSLWKTACFGECIPPWGPTVVSRGGLILGSQQWLSRGTRAGHGYTVQDFCAEQSVFWVSASAWPWISCSLGLCLPSLPSLPLFFVVSDWPWNHHLYLIHFIFFKFNFVYLFIGLVFGRAESWCWEQAFSSCSELGPLFNFRAQASHWSGVSSCGAWS